MIPAAHVLAVSCYLGAAAVAVAPLARPVAAPVRWVVRLLLLGVVAHGTALALAAHELGRLPLTGLGPALSAASFLLALTLLAAEVLARDVSLTIAAAPAAAIGATAANLIGLQTIADPGGVAGVWLLAHIGLSLVGMAAYGTAAAASTMYLVEHRELKSRRFGALFRLFPPLQTLDRVNHHAIVGGWLGLTLGVVLAVTYAMAHHQYAWPKIVWSIAAWLALTAIAFARVAGLVRARRAALLTTLSFLGVIALYLAARAVATTPGRFL